MPHGPDGGTARKAARLAACTVKRVAQAAGAVTIRLRLTKVGRKHVGRLKGARLTLRVVQGPRSTTKRVKLR